MRVQSGRGPDADVVVVDCAPETVLLDDAEVIDSPVVERDRFEVCEVHVLEVVEAQDSEVRVEGGCARDELEVFPEAQEVLRREGCGSFVGGGG